MGLCSVLFRHSNALPHDRTLLNSNWAWLCVSGLGSALAFIKNKRDTARATDVEPFAVERKKKPVKF